MTATMVHMTANFSKVNKFEWMDFKIWQKNMHFFLTSMSVVYVLSTQISYDGDYATIESIRKSKWENDDHVCRGLILNDFMSTSKLNDSTIWHARLGHEHFKRMQNMSKNGLIPAFDLDIENDLCDLHTTPSMRNKKYFVSFIDDASRLCHVYLLHYKDEELDKFKVFKTGVELQQGALIKRLRTDKEGTRYGVSDQHSYCFNVDNEPKTFAEEMKSQDVAFWKEAVYDEMDYIMGNNTWVLADLPPSCKPFSCKWIFKRMMKVDGTIENFKAILVIQGFKQKLGIYYFNTYATLVRSSTIRLLIALVSIQNMIIYQIDVSTTFLNGELDEEVYMNQPQGLMKWFFPLVISPLENGGMKLENALGEALTVLLEFCGE
ncbi:zinc finger, CCHC-type containing protein [Tanacetum coccineum]